MRTDEPPQRSYLGGEREWYVFRHQGTDLPPHAALRLTSIARAALTRAADDVGVLPNELLTWHRRDGTPSNRPHICFIPLTCVGDHDGAGEHDGVGEHDGAGRIAGFAVVLPRTHLVTERQGLARAIVQLARRGRLYDGRNFELDIELLTTFRDTHPHLHPRSYTSPARSWATVTPMVFGRFPGRHFYSTKTIRAITEACEQIGLPLPRQVRVSIDSRHRGAAPSLRHATLTTAGKPVWLDRTGQQRFRAHVTVEFERPVEGPVILGAGRYYGMGLCRPLATPHAGGGSLPGDESGNTSGSLSGSLSGSDSGIDSGIAFRGPTREIRQTAD